jgi:prophage antirepressor-like protein
MNSPAGPENAAPVSANDTVPGRPGAVEVFQFPGSGQEIRAFLVVDDVWIVGRDAALILGHSNPQKAVRDHVPAGHRRVNESFTPTHQGIDPQTVLISEAGLYRLIMRSNTLMAEQFQEWVTAEVLPALRKTGRYEIARLGDPLDEIELANERTSRAVAIAREERTRRIEVEAHVAQLEPRAATLDAIEAGDGLTPRAFHKKYFSDVMERDFFEHLYRRGYLIDQRGKGRWSASQQAYRNGSQHRHPSHKGKPFFYLHTSVDDSEVRRENTRVRPGDPEIALRDRLVREGLPPNSNSAIEKRSA